MHKYIKQTAVVTALAASTVLHASAQSGVQPTSAQDSSQRSTSGLTTSPTTKADHKTTEFIKDAARDNSMEVALAEIAATKAQNPELKAFAQKLQQDHTQANQQLRPLAQKYGVTLDETKARSSHEVTKFEKDASGPAWDKSFVTDSLKSHAKDIQKFQEAANRLQAEDVKQYAQTMLPKLRQHFDQAQTVARAVGVEQSTISSYARKLPSAVGGTSDQQEKMHGTGTSAYQSTTNSISR